MLRVLRYQKRHPTAMGPTRGVDLSAASASGSSLAVEGVSGVWMLLEWQLVRVSGDWPGDEVQAKMWTRRGMKRRKRWRNAWSWILGRARCRWVAPNPSRSILSDDDCPAAFVDV